VASTWVTSEPPSPRSPMPETGEALVHLQWNPWGTTVAAASLDGTIYLVDCDGRSSSERHRPSPVTALAWAPDGTELAVGHHDGTLVVGAPGTRDQRAMRFRAPVWTVAWSPDASHLAVGAGSDVEVFHRDGALVDEFCFLPGSVRALCWAPGPGTLAAGCTGGVRWFDVGGSGPAEAVATFEAPGAVSHLVLDGRSRFLAVGDIRGAVEVHDLWGGDVFVIEALDDKVRALAWTPESDCLVVATDTLVLAWPRDHEGLGPAALSTAEHDDTVTAAAIHPSGAWVASASWDGAVVVTTLASGDVVGAIDVGVAVRCLAWSPSDELLAYGSNDGVVTLATPTLGQSAAS
jgi:WD40 repeat protein